MTFRQRDLKICSLLGSNLGYLKMQDNVKTFYVSGLVVLDLQKFVVKVR